MNDQQILQALGLDMAVNAVKATALAGVKTIVDLRVSGLIQDAMSKEQHDEFARRTIADDKESLMKWVAEEVVNPDELYQSALKDYLEEKKAQL